MTPYFTLYWKPSGARIARGGHSKDLGKISLAVAVKLAADEEAELVVNGERQSVSGNLLVGALGGDLVGGESPDLAG